MVKERATLQTHGPLVIQAARCGQMTYAGAARVARVREETVREWVCKAKGTIKCANPEAYAEFLEYFEQAKEEFLQERLDTIAQASREDSKYWTASAWLLERLDPERYARRQVQHQVEGDLAKRYEFAEPDIPEPELEHREIAIETNGHSTNGNGHQPEDE